MTVHVEPVIETLKEGEIGFLCEGESTSVRFGYPEWTDKDTMDSLSEELIQALYEFYLSEAGVEVESKDEEPVGDEGNSKLLKEPLNQIQSIGDTSSSDSSGSALETKDSTTKTLETSQVG